MKNRISRMIEKLIIMLHMTPAGVTGLPDHNERVKPIENNPSRVTKKYTARKASQGGKDVYKVMALKVAELERNPGPRQAVTLPNHRPNRKAITVPIPNTRTDGGMTGFNVSKIGAPSPESV